ncbi:DUF2125 domain-containing protein [Acuticoccus sp. MNP-M23]|uniref:DUF2125 domain-containing protein n=1 Tax=Acuticoccus sp. MNP-M23 TaxID=3072793 RepID=UPI002814D98D|nr:DUF2125 domain-containing protein [Acuticoccus sp. MNP-M23]WMS43252.1 DUF2125 domain-containing protein [Acuticoccus sp. MNP-M23]
MVGVTATPSRTLRYKVLMLIVLVIIVAWSILWFCAATVLERQADRLQHAAIADGAIVHCLNRTIGGYPFQIEMRCHDGSRLGTEQGSVTLGGLVATALVYRPNRIIMEARGPAVYESESTGKIAADWELAHASARIDLSSAAVTRFDAEVKGGTLTAGSLPPIKLSELFVNARQNPASSRDLDLALRVTGLDPAPGVDTTSLSVRGTLRGGAALLAGDPNAVAQLAAADGLTFRLDEAMLGSGPMQVAASGELSLGQDGHLNGKLDVALAGYDKGVPYVTVFAPDVQDTITTLLGNLLMFAPKTTIGDRPARRLTLMVEDGRVSAGIVPLFRLPPVAVQL